MHSEYDHMTEKAYKDKVISMLTHTRKLFLDVLEKYFSDGLKILDVGCGTGLAEDIILKKFPKSQITLLDKSQNMIDICKKKFEEKCEYIRGDILKTDIEGFDITLVLSVSQDVNKRKKLIEQIFKSIKPGGILVFFTVYTKGWGILTTLANAWVYAKTGHVEHMPKKRYYWARKIEKYGRIEEFKSSRIGMFPHVLIVARKC